VETPPSVQLEAYEGPLDLLLDLIRKQEINIFDIPIAQITQQYLDYLHRMETLNVELAGDFILMAATLILIKSRMLLPADPSTRGTDAEGDPRLDLVARLLEHEKFRNAAQMLQQKQVLALASWSKPDLETFAGEPGELVVSLWDLVKVFRQVLERPPAPAALEIQKEEITVGEMIAELRDALRERNEPIPLLELCQRHPGRRGLIVLFLAVLEMVRLEAIVAVQTEPFAPLLLRKHKLFDVVFAENAAPTVGDYK
jgi:segregation and condensation protein A